MKTDVTEDLKVADEVWIATALLHKENPKQTDFTIAQIVDRARREGLTGELRPGVYVHIVQHCVANRPANPGRYRMLFETVRGRRRLFRKGDIAHATREGAKTAPNREDIPARYRALIDWYFASYFSASVPTAEADPLLAARGSGKSVWSSEPPDSYVQRLRQGWL
jgi:hypothetical protein